MLARDNQINRLGDEGRGGNAISSDPFISLLTVGFDAGWDRRNYSSSVALVVKNAGATCVISTARRAASHLSKHKPRPTGASAIDSTSDS
jgi:uncharacterized Ntn-hydrolase superfamily protein